MENTELVSMGIIGLQRELKEKLEKKKVRLHYNKFQNLNKKQTNEMGFKDPPSPSMAQQKKQEHQLYQKYKEYGITHFDDHLERIDRDKCLKSHTVIDEMYDIKKRKIDNEIKQLNRDLKKDPQVINYLEVNLRNMIKLKKMREEKEKQKGKFDEEEERKRLSKRRVENNLDIQKRQINLTSGQVDKVSRQYKIYLQQSDDFKNDNKNYDLFKSEGILGSEKFYYSYKRRKIMQGMKKVDKDQSPDEQQSIMKKESKNLMTVTFSKNMNKDSQQQQQVRQQNVIVQDESDRQYFHIDLNIPSSTPNIITSAKPTLDYDTVSFSQYQKQEEVNDLLKQNDNVDQPEFYYQNQNESGIDNVQQVQDNQDSAYFPPSSQKRKY